MVWGRKDSLVIEIISGDFIMVSSEKWGRGTSRHIPWHQSQLPPAAKEMANLAWSDDNDGVGFGKVHG